MIILALFVAAPLSVNAATLTWTAPTYTDNTVIPASVAYTIVYTPASGDTPTGPWVAGTNTAAGVLTATLPDSSPGATRWYTVRATLGANTSPWAVPASKTILKSIGAPSIISIQ